MKADESPVYQEGVVQNVELVVEETEFEALRHLVRPALPGEPLVVPGLLVGPDVDRLPVLERLHPLAHMEHVHPRLDLRLGPLQSFRNLVTLRADSLVERNDNVRLEEFH